MPLTSSELESDQEERTRWSTKIMWVQTRESDGANKDTLSTNTGTVKRKYYQSLQGTPPVSLRKTKQRKNSS